MPPSVTILNAVADQFDIDFVASAANQAPLVQINSPTDGQVFSTSERDPFNVTATDADGQVIHLTVPAKLNAGVHGRPIQQRNVCRTMAAYGSKQLHGLGDRQGQRRPANLSRFR